jgi:hypothetical protein
MAFGVAALSKVIYLMRNLSVCLFKSQMIARDLLINLEYDLLIALSLFSRGRM